MGWRERKEFKKSIELELKKYDIKFVCLDLSRSGGEKFTWHATLRLPNDGAVACFKVPFEADVNPYNEEIKNQVISRLLKNII